MKLPYIQGTVARTANSLSIEIGDEFRLRFRNTCQKTLMSFLPKAGLQVTGMKDEEKASRELQL